MRRTPALSGTLVLCAAALSGCDNAENAPAEALDLGNGVEISVPASPGSSLPDLALTPDGRLYLSWVEEAGDSAVLRFSVREGDEWTPPRTIASGTDWFVNWADFPRIAALTDERLAAFYLERRPGGQTYHYDLRVVQSTDGGASWTQPITPHRDSVPAEHGFASMFPMGGDTLGMVWLDGRAYDEEFGGTQEMALMYTTLDETGAAGAEIPIDNRICDCCQTDAALASDGPVVVYRDRSERERRDISITRWADGGWTPAQPVHMDGWIISACPVNGPAVAARDDRVAVAWFTGADDQPRVQVAFSSDGGASFGDPHRVDGGAPLGRVDLVMLPDGGVIVTWLEGGGAEGSRVFGRRVSADGPLEEATALVETSGERASGFPRMSLVGSDLYLAWTQPGEPSQVRMIRTSVE